MKKNMLSLALLLLTFCTSQTVMAQWNALNTGFPTNAAGLLDKINGMATVSHSGKNRLIAATNSKGVYKISVDANGSPVGSTWLAVPGCPYPNKRVSSIVSTGNTFYVCFNDILESGIEVPKIYRCVYTAPEGYAWTLLNNATLPSSILSNGQGFLSIINNVLFFMDDNAGGPFKFVSSSTTWQSFTMTGLISSPIYTMEMINSGTGYVGNNNGIYRFTISGTTGTYTNVYSSATFPACVKLIPYVGPPTSINARTKTLYAVMSSFCPGNHDCGSRLVRYERGSAMAGPDVTYIIGATTSITDILQIKNPASAFSFNTSELLCTNLNTLPGGGIYPLGKSYNEGGSGSTSDWAPANIVGFPNYQYVSCIQNFGTTSAGSVYIGTGEIAPYASSSSNLGFYYFLNTPLLRPAGSNSMTDVNPVAIYPNPTNQTFSITGNEEHAYSLQLSDIQGKQLFSANGTVETINSNLTRLTNLQSGMYLVQIKDLQTQEIKTEKLIKQ